MPVAGYPRLVRSEGQTVLLSRRSVAQRFEELRAPIRRKLVRYDLFSCLAPARVSGQDRGCPDRGCAEEPGRRREVTLMLLIRLQSLSRLANDEVSVAPDSADRAVITDDPDHFLGAGWCAD